MDKDQSSLTEGSGDAQADDAIQPVGPSSKYLKEEIPESRRAVGRFIKKSIQDSQLTVTAYLQAKNRSGKKGVVDRLIQGRKIVRQDEAMLLVELFGGSVEFWMTLEHKILANSHISVPLSDPPRQNLGRDGRHMNGAKNEFGSVSNSSRALSGDFIVLGEGENQVLIPKSLPADEKATLFEIWLNRPKENPEPTPKPPGG